jgi:Tfp pilus assembly protein PilO
MITVVLVAVLIGGGWFMLLAPQREQADKLGSQLSAQRAELDTALAEIAAGLQAKQGYGHAYATVARLGVAVPDDDDVPSLLLQVQQAASAAKVDFRVLKAGQASAVAAPAPTPPASGTASSGATPAAAAAPAALPPGVAVGAAGFPTMPFDLQFSGRYFRLSDFVGRLEHFLVVRNRAVSVSGRFMTIDGIGLDAAPRGFPWLQASVAATTYLLPASEGLTDGATADGPAGATPASTSAGGSGSGSGSSTSSGAPATATASVTPVTR